MNSWSSTVTSTSWSPDQWSMTRFYNVGATMMNESARISEIVDDSSIIVRTIPELIVGTLTLGVIMFLTIFGNVLVILSIFTYRPLKKVQNFFLVSLALADLSVAIMVLPYGIIYFLANRWLFGRVFCQVWLTFDVMLCTSSILNLCAIALDRYWAIHDPINYSNKRTLNLVLMMVAAVWALSILISIPPLVGWNDWGDANYSWNQCAYTREPGFIIYSACGSFFIPLLIMTVVYLKIFFAARTRLRKRVKDTTLRRREEEKKRSELTKLIQDNTDSKKRQLDSNAASIAAPATTTISNNPVAATTTQQQLIFSSELCSKKPVKPVLTKTKSSDREEVSTSASTDEKELVDGENDGSPSPAHKRSEGTGVVTSLYQNPTAILVTTMTHINHPALNELRDLRISRLNVLAAASARRRSLAPAQLINMQNFFKEREKISVSKEKKAAKTLAIIMGVFVLCWLPFFVLYVLMPFCPNQCFINDRIFEATNWLGYINSALNPVIYTIFNMDFRKAFKKLLADFKHKICGTFLRRTHPATT